MPEFLLLTRIIVKDGVQETHPMIINIETIKSVSDTDTLTILETTDGKTLAILEDAHTVFQTLGGELVEAE